MFWEAAGVGMGEGGDESWDLGRLQVSFYHVLTFQSSVGGSREETGPAGGAPNPKAGFLLATAGKKPL